MSPPGGAQPDPLTLLDELHMAVYGEVWARPLTPEQVWRQLVDVVCGMADVLVPAQDVVRTWGNGDEVDPDRMDVVVDRLAAALDVIDAPRPRPAPTHPHP